MNSYEVLTTLTFCIKKFWQSSLTDGYIFTHLPLVQLVQQDPEKKRCKAIVIVIIIVNVTETTCMCNRALCPDSHLINLMC